MVHVKSESLETISIKVEVHGNPCYELVNQEGYVCFHNETIQEYLYWLSGHELWAARNPQKPYRNVGVLLPSFEKK